MRKYIFVAIILISIVLAGCDTNAGTVNLTVNETSAEITEVTNEAIHMNNCGSKGEVKQIAEKSKSVNVEYAGSLGVDKVVVNGEVSAKYGEVTAITKKIELVAPAGTNMQFNLEWTEKTWLGIVTAQDKDGQANYKVSVPISVELVSSQDLGCDTSNPYKDSCPYQTQTDLETITNILNAEANAILQKDINVIKQIYADNAVIKDVQSGQTWNSPVTKYQELFAERDFQKLEHFALQLVKNTGQMAWVTGGVRGHDVYISSGQVEDFESDTHSDHWIFEKNENGCWIITALDFNATNVSFP